MKIKKKLFLALITSLLIIILVGPVIAQTGFLIPSRVEFDQTYSGTKLQDTYNKMNITTQQEAEKYPFTWWRDTTAQNSLWTHSSTQYTNQVIQAYSDGGVRVLVWVSQLGTNVIAIIGPTGNTIIGTGGSRTYAKNAITAFSEVVPNFLLNLRGIIYNEANKEVVWGAAEYVGVNIPREEPLRVISSYYFSQVMLNKDTVATASVNRELYAYGPEISYGPNGNLGTGSEFAYNPYSYDKGIVTPSILVTAPITTSYGGVAIRLIPTLEEEAGLAVYLPNQDVLVLGELFGEYFPPYGSIIGTTNYSPNQWVQVLTSMAALSPNVLISMHSQPITNSAGANKALTDTRLALMSVNAQVVQGINQWKSEADIVKSVYIPADLASSPYVHQHASTIECAVKAIYHYYVGWFNFKVDNLYTFTEREQAQFIVDLAGGPSKALSIAKAYETDHTMPGVQKAIIISGALRLVAPSHDADLVYIQALEKMGYSQESGELRNFYLLTAQKAKALM